MLTACASTPPARPAASLPMVIAHRGGTADAPENTLEAIRLAIEHRADALWLTVQLSRDGVPVLYRPADLSALTDARGPVASHTAAELARVNAGWTFQRPGTGNKDKGNDSSSSSSSSSSSNNNDYPYRDHPTGIPTLREALRAIPPGMPVILDMKALPAAPQTQAVARVLTEEQAWPRVVIYSTEADYQQSFAAYPQARLFESRDATRLRLLQVSLGAGCIEPPAASTWTAFELHRKVTVTEKFTLGEGRSEIDATLWSPESVACFRQRSPQVRIVAIAVNNAADYQAAACLGVDAVLADSPARMAAIRADPAFVRTSTECRR
nr:glycerophosphodiester phosphodiesterase family protein [Achromobacter sp. DH1f]